jgi:hypothetical protein
MTNSALWERQQAFVTQLRTGKSKRGRTTGRDELEYRLQKIKEMKGTREPRAFSGLDLEMREQSDGNLSVVMHASIVETPYEVGWYQETIARAPSAPPSRPTPMCSCSSIMSGCLSRELATAR